MNASLISRVCHEVNRAYCLVIGDKVQGTWMETAQHRRERTFNTVVYYMDHPNASPSYAHEEWLKSMLEMGWKYGPVKDLERKENPDCVAYADLPKERRAKDYIFKAIVDALKDL